MKSQAQNIFIKDYDYLLPQSRIAEVPLDERDQSKLLIYKEGKIIDGFFYDLDESVPPGTTLILNNTRVIEARIFFRKPTGGTIEIFCLEPNQQTIEQSLTSVSKVQWQCLIGGASKWKPGQILKKDVVVDEETIELQATYISKYSDSFIIEFSWNTSHSFGDILHLAGVIPLPPYIKRNATEKDKERYQTIFSRQEGSVAAPTAALHFTENIFYKLSKKKIDTQYITLHVGAGTFKPVKTQTVAEHEMHQEPFTVSIETLKKIATTKQIVAVGTTSLRTLETIYWLGVKLLNGLIKDEWSLHQWEVYDLDKSYPGISTEESLNGLIRWLKNNDRTELRCQTSLIIIPGYQFKIPNGLITNFHQPQSTLLLLVSAFIGPDWKKIYKHALDHDYRFLSYGDSSLLWRNQ